MIWTEDNGKLSLQNYMQLCSPCFTVIHMSVRSTSFQGMGLWRMADRRLHKLQHRPRTRQSGVGCAICAERRCAVAGE
jgi:hypothetical protein